LRISASTVEETSELAPRLYGSRESDLTLQAPLLRAPHDGAAGGDPSVHAAVEHLHLGHAGGGQLLGSLASPVGAMDVSALELGGGSHVEHSHFAEPAAQRVTASVVPAAGWRSVAMGTPEVSIDFVIDHIRMYGLIHVEQSTVLPAPRPTA
jgi:hypothetical protein